MSILLFVHYFGAGTLTGRPPRMTVTFGIIPARIGFTIGGKKQI